jgi:hypothetical protein
MPSTAIADIDYDSERERLTVTFRIYEYVDVSSEVAASLQSVFSKGLFLQQLYSRSL